MSDNRYYVKYRKQSWGSVPLLICSPKQFPQVLPEPLQVGQSFGGGLYNFGFRLKDFPPLDFGQHANDFAHAPAGSTHDLQAVNTRNEQRNAAIADDAHAFGKTLESLELESRHVNPLELFG